MIETPDDCSFLLDAINDGSVPIDNIVKHLEGCKGCRESLAFVYGEYVEYCSAGRPKKWHSGCVCSSLKWIPAGLDGKQFLSGWRVGITRRWEMYGLRVQALAKIHSSEGRRWVGKLLERIHRIVSLRQLNAPKTVLQDEWKLLTEAYMELQELFGSQDILADFLGLDIDNAEADMERVFHGWKTILGLQDSEL